MNKDERCFVFLNGDFEDKKDFYLKIIDGSKNIFCADGGANFCYKFNLIPLEIWGDMDSINEDTKKFYINKNVLFKMFPKEKDFTDTELILEYLSKKFKKITCFFGISKEMAHTLTNFTLFYKFKNIEFINFNERISFLEEKKEYYIENKKNTKISFVPYSFEIKNLTLNGFKYNLVNYNLNIGESILTSNIINEDKAFVYFDCGKLLMIEKNS